MSFSKAKLLASLSLSILLLAGCQKKVETPKGPEHTAVMRGKIAGRDVSTNQLTIDGEKAGELMDAMTMPYEVRGVKVATLPPDGTAIEATLHEQDGAYWVSEIKVAK